MAKRDDDTQIRVIRSVAQEEMRDERVFYLAEMRKALKDIKSEMHTHFATKADLANWELDLTEHHNRHVRKSLEDHTSKYHKPISMIPKPAWSKKTIGIISGVIVILSGIATAIAAFID